MRIRALLTSAAAAVLIAGCGGSATKPSTTQLSRKLAKEPSIRRALASAQKAAPGSTSAIKGIEVRCMAEAVRDNATNSSLADYVAGKIPLAQVKGDQSKANTQAFTCSRDAMAKRLKK
ncbi:MAG: hypothetical protein J2O48_11330 [Solirubrobacterales bacterium]|nr:hypothetical protein [Solirubrobacterales bacterium]